MAVVEVADAEDIIEWRWQVAVATPDERRQKMNKIDV